jgi:predicted deacylase
VSTSFKIRDIIAKKGKKVDGFLEIENDDAGVVKLYIGIVNGVDDGPVVCVTGGMYGTIYPGIDACIRVFNELDPMKLKGTVITIPVIEMTGFQQCMDESPIDGRNPNRLFPGNAEGTISNRIAYAVFHEVIKKSNYHLDLRGGSLWEFLHTFSVSCKMGNKELDKKTEELARILGPKYLLIIPDMKGSLICEASRIGIPSIILEAARGLANYDEEDIQLNLKGIYNLLKHLNMIDGTPDIPDEILVEEFHLHRITAEKGGLLYLDCKFGDIKTAGQKLGEIRNLKGETIQELIAPIDGIVHMIFPKHIKHPGETILGMRTLSK